MEIQCLLLGESDHSIGREPCARHDLARGEARGASRRTDDLAKIAARRAPAFELHVHLAEHQVDVVVGMPAESEPEMEARMALVRKEVPGSKLSAHRIGPEPDLVHLAVALILREEAVQSRDELIASWAGARDARHQPVTDGCDGAGDGHPAQLGKETLGVVDGDGSGAPMNDRRAPKEHGAVEIEPVVERVPP